MSEWKKAADLERKLAENEAELAKLHKEQARERELAEAFGFLRTAWVKQIEQGTVDRADLIARLERALDKARNLDGEQIEGGEQ